MTKKIESKFKNVNVLAVEDFALNREVIIEMLHVMGIDADVAEDGEQAVEKVQQKSYDLILMDIRMPRKDGYEATREIRKLHLEKQPIILALTASALPVDQDKCINAGMDDFITKPLDVWQLEEVLNKYLAKFKV